MVTGLRTKFEYELPVPEYRRIEATARSTFAGRDNAALERERHLLFHRLIALESEQARRKAEYVVLMRKVKKYVRTT